LGRVGSESFALLGGSACLHMTGLYLKRIVDPNQTLVGCRIPRRVRNRAGRDQRNAHPVRSRPRAGHKVQRQHSIHAPEPHCGPQTFYFHRLSWLFNYCGEFSPASDRFAASIFTSPVTRAPSMIEMRGVRMSPATIAVARSSTRSRAWMAPLTWPAMTAS
jgi:hypothetical protein